jgi:hypothetical protein
MILLAALPAFAQDPGKVIELRVPEPTQMPPLPPSPTAAPADDPTAATATAPAAARGAARPKAAVTLRPVTGISPSTLWGRYMVVQVTEGGETVSYAEKMARASMALQADCTTVGLVFDFGAPNPGLPQQVQIAEYRHCTKGGLGTYASELALALPATFDPTPGGLSLKLPAVKALGSLVRVRTPTEQDLSTPSHWMGPQVTMQRPEVQYTVVAEFDPPKKGAAPGDPATPARVVHLVSGGGAAELGSPQIVLHLEPELDASAWMQAAAAVPAEK